MNTGPASDPPSRDSKGFEQFCVDLAEQLTRPLVMKLARVFGCSVAEISDLKAVPGQAHDFVEYLRKEGIIQEDNITRLTDTLEKNNLREIAYNIRRSFDKNVQSSRGEKVPEEFPYLTINDFEEYMDNPDILHFLNEKGGQRCRKLFRNYTLESNRSGGRPPPSVCVDHLRVVIVGKTGSGKSATANSLLGGDFFHHGDSARSVTESSGIATSEIGNGRRISVVDSPGMINALNTDRDVMREIARVAYLLREGVHAILYVVNGCDCRFSKGDNDAIDLLMREFKTEFTDHCLVVYSRADGFLSESKTLDAFIDEQRRHEKIGSFLDCIGWKILAVNNKTKIPAELKRNQEALVNMIDQIVSYNQGQVYTNELFRKAQARHEGMIVQCKKYHPALVSAVIEYYHSPKYSDIEDGPYQEVSSILENAGTILKYGGNVVLTDGERQQILSYEEYRNQILSIYGKVGMNDFFRSRFTVPGTVLGIIQGAGIGGMVGGPLGALAGSLVGALTGALANILVYSADGGTSRRRITLFEILFG